MKLRFNRIRYLSTDHLSSERAICSEFKHRIRTDASSDWKIQSKQWRSLWIQFKREIDRFSKQLRRAE